MSPNFVTRTTDTNKMSPQTFVDRLPELTRAHYTNALASIRRPLKTLEESPLSFTEMQNLKAALVYGHSSAQDALEYLHQQEANLRNYPRMRDYRPPEGVKCYSYQFDNIQLWFHPDDPTYYRDGSYSVYMGPRGCEPSECADWNKHGIRVTAEGLDGEWGLCRMLQMVPAGTYFKIYYVTDQGERRIKRLRLPTMTVEESRRYFVGAANSEEFIDLGSVTRSSGHN